MADVAAQMARARRALAESRPAPRTKVLHVKLGAVEQARLALLCDHLGLRAADVVRSVLKQEFDRHPQLERRLRSTEPLVSSK